VKPHEAALTQYDPAIIGLVSLFIDSVSQEEIMTFIRRCATRGQDILFPHSSATHAKVVNAQPNQMKARTPALSNRR
jgi:hypothetical protein